MTCGRQFNLKSLRSTARAMIRRGIERSLEIGAKCPVHFIVIKSSINVRALATFVGSLEDEATYVRWRRGMFIIYGSVGLTAIAVVLATHLSQLAIQLAGN
jgi:hypothetical protein